MPILKDYVAALVSSITEARVSSDAITAEVAKTYLNSDLLRHFSVPRMRIGNVDMNVPVAIDFTDGKTTINYNTDVTEMTESIYSIVCFGFGYSVKEINENKELASALRAKILKDISALKAIVENMHNLDSLKEYSINIAEDSKSIFLQWKYEVDKVSILEVAFSIETALRNFFLYTSVDKIDVLVEAAQLKQQSAQSLLNLKITIVEEGMEWAISQNDKGEVETKLIPE